MPTALGQVDYKKIGKKFPQMRNRVTITYNDITLTAAQWAQHLQVSPYTFIKVILPSWIEEDVIDFLERPHKHFNMLTWQGRTMTLTAWAEELGMEMPSLKERIEKWGVEKAMTTPVTPRARNR